MPEPTKHYDYDVALSYASEDNQYANLLATTLRIRGAKVFYDKYEKSELWGQNLYSYLADLYQNRARYCVVFLSQHYVAKIWTNHEREAAQARAFKEQQEYILPIRLDDTEIPGIPLTIGYLSWSSDNVESIADAVMKKLNQTITDTRQPELKLIPPIESKLSSKNSPSKAQQTLSASEADAQTLLKYRAQIKSIRDLLLYEMDLRRVSQSIIDGLVEELRKTTSGIEMLSFASHIDELMFSVMAAQRYIREAIQNLYLASDILDKHNVSIRERQTLYQKLGECADSLSQALTYFII